MMLHVPCAAWGPPNVQMVTDVTVEAHLVLPADPLGSKGNVVTDAADGLADRGRVRRVQCQLLGAGVVAAPVQSDGAGNQNVGFLPSISYCLGWLVERAGGGDGGGVVMDCA